mmetsp:Transcript_57991/g.184197  ORF Transcript_57991/g.184197 Transcript_57991/m.184197 type:complete len:384 (-) Transcript_57991:3509-4660(-)
MRPLELVDRLGVLGVGEGVEVVVHVRHLRRGGEGVHVGLPAAHVLVDGQLETLGGGEHAAVGDAGVAVGVGGVVPHELAIEVHEDHVVARDLLGKGHRVRSVTVVLDAVAHREDGGVGVEVGGAHDLDGVVVAAAHELGAALVVGHDGEGHALASQTLGEGEARDLRGGNHGLVGTGPAGGVGPGGQGLGGHGDHAVGVMGHGHARGVVGGDAGALVKLEVVHKVRARHAGRHGALDIDLGQGRLVHGEGVDQAFEHLGVVLLGEAAVVLGAEDEGHDLLLKELKVAIELHRVRRDAVHKEDDGLAVVRHCHVLPLVLDNHRLDRVDLAVLLGAEGLGGIPFRGLIHLVGEAKLARVDARREAAVVDTEADAEVAVVGLLRNY